MAEDIKALIEKINQEGVVAAEARAKEIEDKAKLKADEIIKKAQGRAEKISQETKEALSLAQEKEKSLLNQAGRDLLLVLRQEINDMLARLINLQVQDALTPESLSRILTNITHNFDFRGGSEIIISVNKDDLGALESGFLAKLKDEAKKKIILKSSDDIRAGFIISYDAGKSQFDFTDASLAGYIGTFLKPKLKEILQV